MVLVPPEMAQQFTRSPHNAQEPTYAGLDNLDLQMQDILRRNDIPQDRKIKLYQQALLGYINLHQKLNQPVAVTIQNEPSPQEINTPPALPSKQWIDTVVEGVPYQFKSKAKRLIRLIHNADGAIDFDAQARLILNGQSLVGTHALDLIKYIVTKSSRSKTGPNGWREFSIALAPLNPPRDLIVNEESWKLMHSKLPLTPEDIAGEEVEKEEEAMKDADMGQATPTYDATLNRSARRRPSQRMNKNGGQKWKWFSQYPDQ